MLKRRASSGKVQVVQAAGPETIPGPSCIPVDVGTGRRATGNTSGRLEPASSSAEDDPIRSHEHSLVELKPLSMLLLEDDPQEEARLLSSVRTTPTEIQCVPTVRAALQLLEQNCFDAIMIDRHLGGWVSAKTCRDLVARAGDIPVVGLINENCVLGLQDGIEAGLRGVYYKDQMDAHLMRRLSRLSRGPSVHRAPAAASSLRQMSARMPRARS